MKLTSAYYVGAVAGIALALFIIIQTDNVILGVILGIVAAVAAYKITAKIEDGLAKGINTVAYSGSRQLVQELLSSTLVFDTSVSKDEIMANFLNKFPSEMKIVSWKMEWTCARGNNDALFFVIGVRSIQYVEHATTPVTVARLNFQTTPDNRTNATFAFVSRTDYQDGSIPFSKDMAQLVGTVKDTFMTLDARCKITENKSGGNA